MRIGRSTCSPGLEWRFHSPHLDGRGGATASRFPDSRGGWPGLHHYEGRYKLIRSRGNAKAPKPGTKNKKRTKKSGVGKDVGKVQLYDLKTDPAEKNNIASKRPQAVKELNALLTGERVDEAAGFANTYHSWQGTKDASITNPLNWSDYVYLNAGITYTQESGSPKAHWSAEISQGSVLANKDATFLGLEVGGGLTVKLGITIHARNELRVADKGQLVLQGGTVESLRWVDIQSGGTLTGHGAVNASLYANGTLALSVDKPLVVEGAAKLSGKLKLTGANKPKSGKSHTVLKAKSISGRFENDKISLAGKSYSIAYTATSVTVMAK